MPAMRRKVRQDHEAGDVVHPPASVDVVHDRSDAGHRRRARCGQRPRQGPRGTEGVLPAVVVAEVPVEAVDVLAPADDLTDEPLARLHRDGAVHVPGQDGSDDLAGMQQAQVQVGAQQGVVRRPGVRWHRVLVGTEAGEGVLDEVNQLPEGAGPRRRPRPVGSRAGHRQSPALDVRPDGLIDRVHLMSEDRGPRVGTLGRRQAVVGVEAPSAADGAVPVHQDAQASALPAVEGVHARMRLIGSPRRRSRRAR